MLQSTFNFGLNAKKISNELHKYSNTKIFNLRKNNKTALERDLILSPKRQRTEDASSIPEDTHAFDECFEKFIHYLLVIQDESTVSMVQCLYTFLKQVLEQMQSGTAYTSIYLEYTEVVLVMSDTKKRSFKSGLSDLHKLYQQISKKCGNFVATWFVFKFWAFIFGQTIYFEMKSEMQVSLTTRLFPTTLLEVLKTFHCPEKLSCSTGTYACWLPHTLFLNNPSRLGFKVQFLPEAIESSDISGLTWQPGALTEILYEYMFYKVASDLKVCPLVQYNHSPWMIPLSILENIAPALFKYFSQLKWCSDIFKYSHCDDTMLYLIPMRSCDMDLSTYFRCTKLRTFNSDNVIYRQVMHKIDLLVQNKCAHWDLTTANIVLNSNGSNVDAAYIIDFGTWVSYLQDTEDDISVKILIRLSLLLNNLHCRAMIRFLISQYYYQTTKKKLKKDDVVTAAIAKDFIDGFLADKKALCNAWKKNGDLFAFDTATQYIEFFLRTYKHSNMHNHMLLISKYLCKASLCKHVSSSAKYVCNIYDRILNCLVFF